MTFIVIGVDGGGSKTRVVVADEEGTQLGEVVGPASAVRPGQAERSAEVIATTVRDALASCEMTHVMPKVLCVGVAGVAREAERQALWQALVGRELAEETVVHTDFSVALDDALWLPREDQLRELLGGTFRSLDRTTAEHGGVVYTVRSTVDGVDSTFSQDDPTEAYGLAVLALIRSVRAE